MAGDYGFKIDVSGDAISVMKQIEAELGKLGIEASVETKKVESSFAGMGEGIKGIFGGLKSMIIGGLGIAAVMEGFEFIKKGKEAFDALEESDAKVNAALISTKGIAGETSEELEKIAKATSGKTLFGRAAITDAESMLLTFTSIRGEIYEKTMPAIADFATRFKMDLPEAANTLGKALNDPLKGMTRLQRQGVVFSDQQKATIKNFMETGQVAKAQEVILGELSNEYGGIAEAMAKTDEGKVKMAAKSWGELKLAVGELVSKLQVAFVPILLMITGTLKGIYHFFQSDTTAALIFKDVILAIGVALGLYYANLVRVSIWTKVLTKENWKLVASFFANPVVWVVAGIAAIIAVIMVCWDKFKGFREFLGGAFGFIKQQVVTLISYLKDLGQVFYDLFSGNFKKAWEDGKKLITDFKENVTTGMTEAIKKGAEDAGNSDFKFGDLLKFGDKKTFYLQDGDPAAPVKGKGLKDSALNTSNLSGASGGLGQAKVINIKIDTMQKVITTDNKDLKHKGQDAVEVMLRTVNNLALSQGGVQ